MSKIKVLSFDLSTSCIGVLAAFIDTDTKTPIVVKSCPIIPSKFNPSILGYEKTKKKLKTKDGSFLNTYYKKGELTISKNEKQKRDREVRRYKDNHVLTEISKKLTSVIEEISPEIILVEKNEIFNGILTTVLLAKVLGTLFGAASKINSNVIEIKVKTARSILDLTKCIEELRNFVGEDELSKIPDVTKRALRYEMEKKYGEYGLKCTTDDESDACVIFNYWLEKM